MISIVASIFPFALLKGAFLRLFVSQKPSEQPLSLFESPEALPTTRDILHGSPAHAD